jgi:hypothetical protein
MMSDFITSSVEQCCIIKFVVKEKVKVAEFLRRLSVQYAEGRYHMQVCMIGAANFLKAMKR